MTRSATTPTVTDPATLPQWQGRPVPWITKWTGETSMDPFTFGFDRTGQPVVTYPDGHDNRDDHGFLWRREGAGRKGEPQFREVNAYRQKQSMRVPRCQVCGTTLRLGPLLWLLPKEGSLAVSPEGVATTHVPPTCEACIPLARQLCPHLRKEGSNLVRVDRFHVWGVMGEAIMLDGNEVIAREKDVCLEYGRSYRDVSYRNFVVRQQMVALDDFTVVEES